MESFHKKHTNKLIGNVKFVQENESESSRGVLRGLHFQNPPYAQAKLVRCIKGSVLDVALDLRKDSKTYGCFETTLLSEENKLLGVIFDVFSKGRNHTQIGIFVSVFSLVG